MDVDDVIHCQKLSHILTPRGGVNGDDVPAERVSGDVDHADLPDGVATLQKFIWRPQLLLVDDNIDELDSGSGNGYGFRATGTLTDGVLHFLVVTIARQVRFCY